MLGESMKAAAEIRTDIHQLEAGARARRDYAALSALGECLRHLGKLEDAMRRAEGELRDVAAEAVDAVLEKHEVLP